MLTVTATLIRPLTYPGTVLGHIRSIDPEGSTYDRPVEVEFDARPTAAELAALLAVPAGEQVTFMTNEAPRFHGDRVVFDVGTAVQVEFDFDGPQED